VTGRVTLALDAASSRLTIAAERAGTVAARHLDGSRHHTAQVLVLIDEVLTACGAVPRDIGAVISGEGPGSFTGLRVAASVAKALVWRREDVTWHTGSSLLARIPLEAGHRRVLALSDALRGEVYAGCWELGDGAIRAIDPPARAVRPEELSRFGAVDLVVGSIPDALVPDVARVTAKAPVTGEAALPDARRLLALRDWRGGLVAVHEALTWHPEYGRPAEAQVVWERKHGIPLPDPGHSSR
jgi:tRNA threonylcarbamoyladenosine biosynthesis protein TsaB